MTGSGEAESRSSVMVLTTGGAGDLREMRLQVGQTADGMIQDVVGKPVEVLLAGHMREVA